MRAARSSFADARLSFIERAIANAESRLTAMMQREDTGDGSADVTPLHVEIGDLVWEAACLRPATDAGFASKGRIVLANYELSAVGKTLLRSLVRDLAARVPTSRR